MFRCSLWILTRLLPLNNAGRPNGTSHTNAHPADAVFSLRPLHVAARNGLKAVVEELLAKGACVLAVDENGEWGKYTITQGPSPCWGAGGREGCRR